MDIQLSESDFKEICRFCLQFAVETNPQFPLFLHHGQYGRYLKGSNESLPEIINSCLGLKIEPDDGLPLNICKSCENSLITANAFRLKCYRSIDTLKQIQNKLKANSVTNSDAQHYDSEDELPLTQLEVVKAEDSAPMQEELMDYIITEDIGQDYESNSDSDYVAKPAAQYSHLQIETLDPVDATPLKPPQFKQSPYTSVKRPLKSIPKSEIASASRTLQQACDRKLSCSELQTSDDQTLEPALDSSQDFEQSADDSAAQDEASDNSKQTKSKSNKAPRVHLGKQCYVCGLIVTRMRDHMKSHPGELQYKCEHCARSYLTKTGRDRHMDAQHPETRSDTSGGGAGDGGGLTSSGRRSYANTHLWKCNVNKTFRDMGECYLSVSGVVRPARTVKAGCPEQCTYECRLNFDQTERERIHKDFWALSVGEKRAFYLRMVDQICPKRKRVVDSTQRMCTYVYHFELHGEKRLQVCSRFFFSTIDVNRKRLYRVFQKSVAPATATPTDDDDDE